tara:strand:- start:1512 stop:1985 length:474 start_codon:yes stop_codon:yes gene_type:complete
MTTNTVNSNQPYSSNYVGFVGSLEDFRLTIGSIPVVTKVVGYSAEVFENVTQGDALFCRNSDGKLGKAIANDTREKAHVAGFAETTVSAGSTVRAMVRGLIATSGLNAGNIYFLSHLSAGAITETPSTTAGHFVVPVGEAGTSAQFIIKVEPEILLS